MGGSLLIISFFCAGVFMALFGVLPQIILERDPSLPALWLLMFIVGFSLGAEGKLSQALRSMRPGVLLIPLSATAGTFAGALIASALLAWTIGDCLAIGAGFAYYSLSSVLITQCKGPELGAAALLCNIARELFTLVFTPLIVRFCGPAAAIACGGATTMDTTLPVIIRWAGAEWVPPALVSAVIIDFSVPFWVALFCAI